MLTLEIQVQAKSVTELKELLEMAYNHITINSEPRGHLRGISPVGDVWWGTEDTGGHRIDSFQEQATGSVENPVVDKKSTE